VTVPPRISEPDPLLDEALDWVVRLRTGEPTRADIEALQQWRGRSVAHEDAFKRAAQIFRHAGIAAVELAVEQARKERAPANPRRRVFVRRALLGGGRGGGGRIYGRSPAFRSVAAVAGIGRRL
jgi:ferric-dicitrate binding protein FerR (iron transport regulator)